MADIDHQRPAEYLICLMRDSDKVEISAICARVYPTERPYNDEELSKHHALFPEGQFVVQHIPTGAVASAHCTLVINMLYFHVDDSWETLTAGGTFSDHDPKGRTLYGSDLFVHPGHQHHGLGRALTEATRGLVREKGLVAHGWRKPHARRRTFRRLRGS